ncbi:hypothetical protein ACLQ2R_20505 [Streptosporangium sp. DT93]|uniref:hypothetical protein n=1 Tax=Streptosporangium sp. DT93 TaxID=3393428 RepID=UPI003CE8FA78
MSITWAAARTARGFRAARRAGLAARSGVRRWDAEATAAVVALVAWLTAWWRHRAPRTTRTSEPADTASSDTASDATETPSAPNDPPTPENGPADRPASAATDRDRRRHPYTASTGTYRRTRTMSTFPLAATAAEMNAAAASHAPADMWVVSRELDQLTEVPAYVALAIRTYTQRLQAEYPIHPAVIEAIHLLYQGQAQLVSLAEEIGPLFRQAHADDLKREEAPRINEPLWNV